MHCILTLFCHLRFCTPSFFCVLVCLFLYSSIYQRFCSAPYFHYLVSTHQHNDLVAADLLLFFTFQIINSFMMIKSEVWALALKIFWIAPSFGYKEKHGNMYRWTILQVLQSYCGRQTKKPLNFGFSLEKCNLICGFSNSWVYDNKISCFNICLTDSKNIHFYIIFIKNRHFWKIKT